MQFLRSCDAYILLFMKFTLGSNIYVKIMSLVYWDGRLIFFKCMSADAVKHVVPAPWTRARDFGCTASSTILFLFEVTWPVVVQETCGAFLLYGHGLSFATKS